MRVGTAGGVPEPAALRLALAAAPEVGVLVVTLPDNPTGTVAGAELLREIAQIAEEHDLFVVSEEIYRDLAFVRRRHPGERGSRRGARC